MSREGKTSEPIEIDFDDDGEEPEDYERLSFVDIVEDRISGSGKHKNRTPDDVAPLLSRWLLAFSTGDYEDAINAASDAVFKLPDDHSVRCKLATSFLMAGKYAEATNALDYILSKDPEHEEALSLADSREILAYLLRNAKEALKKRDFDAALPSIDRAIRFVPGYAESYFLRAIVRYQKGKLEDCKQDLQTTLDLEPRHEQAKSLIAEISKRQAGML